MLLNSCFVFVSFLLIPVDRLLCLWTATEKDNFKTYVIDVLFTNSLTIVRCNPYERHVLRDITMEALGHIKCSNRNTFLPDNHIEHITLLEWLNTSVICNKKNVIEKEITYFLVKHSHKNAFKKNPLKLVRVGSLQSSELHSDKKHSLLYFKHPPRNLLINGPEEKNDTFSTDIYSFRHRPILCRERHFSSEQMCTNNNQHDNFSYVCYYKIGADQPPTIAELTKELRTLPKGINTNENSVVDVYLEKYTEKKSLLNNHFIIAGVLIVAFIIIGVILWFCYCNNVDQNKEIRRVQSNSSTTSRISTE